MAATEFFTWQFLITFAGAMTATGILTQFLKGLIDQVFKIPTQLLAYIIALVVMNAGQFVLGEFSIGNLGLNFINAVLIATATSGTYDAVKRVS